MRALMLQKPDEALDRIRHDVVLAIDEANVPAIDVAGQFANEQLTSLAFANDAAIRQDTDAHVVFGRFLDRPDRPKLHAHLPAQLVFLGPKFSKLA